MQIAVAYDRALPACLTAIPKFPANSGVEVGRGSQKAYTRVHELFPAMDDDMTEMADHIEAIGVSRDRNAFNILFRFYAPRIKGVLMRAGAGAAEAEEVMQETMVLIWRKAAQFDRTKASPSAWIYTIARNRRIDLLRREKRPELDPDDPFFTTAGAVPDGEETYSENQRQAVLEDRLQILPPEQMLLVRKAFYEDMTHQAIAAELELPLGTVKSRLRIALRDLRASLSGEEI